jgi:hypothetical protein
VNIRPLLDQTAALQIGGDFVGASGERLVSFPLGILPASHSEVSFKNIFKNIL